MDCSLNTREHTSAEITRYLEPMYRRKGKKLCYMGANKDNRGFLLEQLQPVPLMEVQEQKLAAQGMRSFLQMAMQTSW